MKSLTHLSLALALVLASAALGAQAPAPQSSLAGVIDLHAHAGPDTADRSIDAIDLAKLAHDRGMRGLLLKNHGQSTASLVYAARKAVPGVELFGGIALNRSAGGINAAAVEEMASTKGGWGRVVWMPTRDAEYGARNARGAPRPFVSVARDGQLLPEVKDVLKIMAARKLTLATGHSSPTEDLLLIREAKAAGVEHIIVTHPMNAAVGMSVDQMKEAAALGAYLELAYGHLLGNQGLKIEAYAAAIRAIGPEHFVMSTDLGQPGNPLHPDGMEAFMREMAKQGFGKDAIDRMTKTNPANVLGLE